MENNNMMEKSGGGEEEKEKEGGGELNKINKKYKIIEKSRYILDLCAAPGDWFHFAALNSPNGSFLLAVDILPVIINHDFIINNNNNNTVTALQADITTPSCSEAIKRVMEEHGCPGFDLVLHDAVSDIYARDANELPLQSVKLATQFLAPNGTFVTKADRKAEYFHVLHLIAMLFEKFRVEDFDGQTYLVGFNYKAPSLIDPLLFNVDQLFGKCPDPPQDRYSIAKSTRCHDWWFGGRKECHANRFVWSDNPLEILHSSSQIVFWNANDIKYHKLTTDEVRLACSNTYAMLKPGIKLLIKWHAAIRVALTKSKPVSTSKKVEPKSEERKVVKMLRETLESIFDMHSKKNPAKKLIAEKQFKDKTRTATGMQMYDVVYGCGDQEQVALSTVKEKEDSVAVGITDKDFEEELKKCHERLEDLAEQAYNIYEKKRYVSRKRKVKHPKKSERSKATFNDDVYSDYVTTKLFGPCFPFSDNNVDEVKNKAKSDSEEKVEKGKSVVTV